MQKIVILTLTSVATAAVAEYRFVDHDGSQCDVAGTKPLGVSVHAAKVGEPFAVDVLGTTKVDAGAPIPLGPKGLTPVMAAADGRAIPYAAGAGAEIAGYARQPAGAAGMTIEVLLTP